MAVAYNPKEIYDMLGHEDFVDIGENYKSGIMFSLCSGTLIAQNTDLELVGEDTPATKREVYEFLAKHGAYEGEQTLGEELEDYLLALFEESPNASSAFNATELAEVALECKTLIRAYLLKKYELEID